MRQTSKEFMDKLRSNDEMRKAGDYMYAPYVLPPPAPASFGPFLPPSQRRPHIFSDKYILTRAKELWPDLDVEKVSVFRAERPNVDVVALTEHPGAPDIVDTIRVHPLMTTEGLALSWVPEANVVVYLEAGP